MQDMAYPQNYIWSITIQYMDHMNNNLIPDMQTYVRHIPFLRLIIIIFMSDILYNLFLRFQFTGYMRFTSGRHWHATNLLHDHSNLSPSYLFSQRSVFTCLKVFILLQYIFITKILYDNSFSLFKLSFWCMNCLFEVFRDMHCLAFYEICPNELLYQYFK